MNSDVENHIRNNDQWSKLPTTVKQSLGSSKEYDRCILTFSIKNQLRHKTNIVRFVKKDERAYYDDLLDYSRGHLMLFPYHLSDIVIRGMRLTPFQFYSQMMQQLMEQERSYDSLPNFTAADCVRLLAIGRNQYIDMMNQCRSTKTLFRKRNVKDLLPARPCEVTIEPWWIINIGYITDDDIKMISSSERRLIDQIIDTGSQRAAELDCADLSSLYAKGLIYIDVPIDDTDCIVVPPLEGFVMNRVLGDYFEKLLYKIFVSIDEHTPVCELANILQIDLDLVKDAVSMYCRLGMARRKSDYAAEYELHPSWRLKRTSIPKKSSSQDELLSLDWNATVTLSTPAHQPGSSDSEVSSLLDVPPSFALTQPPVTTSGGSPSLSLRDASASKRIAFLFDSTLTAFLMMGNLSPGLKSHAVTMFEVGKLSDEALDSFIQELDKIGDIGEGEARRYFDHALTLRSTVCFLRHNRELGLTQAAKAGSDGDSSTGAGGVASVGLDLIRCESLCSLDPDSCTRLLSKNYSLLVSMTPLCSDIRSVVSVMPPHLGSPIPEMATPWFKLFLYCLVGSGPPSLLLAKGTRLKKIPKCFLRCSCVLVTTWGHDPSPVPLSNLIVTLNEALTHSAILVQGHDSVESNEELVAFPFDEQRAVETEADEAGWRQTATIRERLERRVPLVKHCCGYVTLLRQRPGRHNRNRRKVDLRGEEEVVLRRERTVEATDDVPEEEEPVVLDCHFGLPLFQSRINAQICDIIVQRGLCSETNLQMLTQESRLLALQFLDFVARLQNDHASLLANNNNYSGNQWSKWGDGMHGQQFPKKHYLFDGGRLAEWTQA